VIVGILFLVIEISQNTTAIENETRWNRVSTAAEIMSPMIENDDFAAAFIAYRNFPGEARQSDSTNFSQSELFRVENQLRLIALQTEARFITQSTTLDQQRSTMRSILSDVGVRAYYKRISNEFEPEFARFIDSIIAEIEN